MYLFWRESMDNLSKKSEFYRHLLFYKIYNSTISPLILLVTLSITFAELFTGSTLFFELFNPVSMLFLIGLYGGGVVAIREFTVRYGGNWTTLLLLGSAYGIIEEGFATKTFFDPSKAGFLGVFGRAFGVNWVWVVLIIAFHAVYSITLPILLIRVIFPYTKGKPILPWWGMYASLTTFLITALLLFFVEDPAYNPSPLLLITFAGISIIIVCIAHFLPSIWFNKWAYRKTINTKKITIASGLFIWLSIAISGIIHLFIPIPVIIVLLNFIAGIVTFRLVLNAGVVSNDPRTIVALATGLLSFWLVYSAILEIFYDWGVGIATTAVIVMLYALNKKTNKILQIFEQKRFYMP